MNFDHIVLGARTLDEGIAYVYDQLGIRIAPGGSHARYGTHNAVLRLDSQSYFEIIAIEPGIKPTHLPRWYGMDEADTVAQLASGPRLLAWVAATPDIDDVCNRDSHSVLYGEGEVVTIQRDNLQWRMWIPNCGKLKNPLLPWLIDWSIGIHPCELLPRSDCHLINLQAFHANPAHMQSFLVDCSLDAQLSLQDVHNNQGKQQLKAQFQCRDRTAEFFGLEFD